MPLTLCSVVVAAYRINRIPDGTTQHTAVRELDLLLPLRLQEPARLQVNEPDVKKVVHDIVETSTACQQVL